MTHTEGETRALERMAMVSVVPVASNLDRTPAVIQSALAGRVPTLTKSMSHVTRSIDAVICSTCLKSEIKHSVLIPLPTGRPVTRYSPHFKVFGARGPDPTTYTPRFEAVLPSAPVVLLPAASFPARDSDAPAPARRPLTLAGVTQLYFADIRGFDVGGVDVLEAPPVATPPAGPRRPSPCFVGPSERLGVTAPSPAAHLEPADPPEPRPLSVLDFTRDLRDRVLPVTVDMGRDYPRAVGQARGVKPRIRNAIEFARQLRKEPKPAGNRRVAMLDRLTQEQSKSIRRMMAHPARATLATPRRPGAFGEQLSMGPRLYPGECQAAEKENFMQFDPLVALKRPRPRTQAVAIGPRRRELTPGEF